jgi:hypothetical protein
VPRQVLNGDFCFFNASPSALGAVVKRVRARQAPPAPPPRATSSQHPAGGLLGAGVPSNAKVWLPAQDVSN